MSDRIRVEMVKELGERRVTFAAESSSHDQAVRALRDIVEGLERNDR